VYEVAEPDARGELAVGDGQLVYWERVGAADGLPAVVLHGGPGAGAAPWWRALLDPAAFRTTLFDQRGCGRSTPNAGDPGADLAVNTTDRLIADIERLRELAGVERWLVLGGSWGSTLALAYAQAHAERVAALVLFAVVTTTPREVEWITVEMGRIFPAEWERFRAGAGELGAGERIVDGYARRLSDGDERVRERAARDWCEWEDTHVRALGPGHDTRFDDPAFRACWARLVTHYWRHGAWRMDGELLAGVRRLEGTPAVLVHGQVDVSSPLGVPWELARSWPAAELRVVGDAGHGGPAITAQVVAATDGFARRPELWR